MAVPQAPSPRTAILVDMVLAALTSGSRRRERPGPGPEVDDSGDQRRGKATPVGPNCPSGAGVPADDNPESSPWHEPGRPAGPRIARRSVHGNSSARVS